ncbi:hypothetical protein Tco_0709832 [Tanacetum coccineum]
MTIFNNSNKPLRLVVLFKGIPGTLLLVWLLTQDHRVSLNPISKLLDLTKVTWGTRAIIGLGIVNLKPNQLTMEANLGLNQQAQAYQVPSTQVPVAYSRFEAYTKANDATLTNLQKNLNDFKREQQDFQNEQRNFQNMMLNMFQKQMGNNNASGSGTLPNNVMARKHEVTKTNVQPESSQSTANVQPRVDHGKGKDKLKDDELEKKKDGFPSRNDESILKEEVHKETLKSYLNPLFEDDEEIISIEVSRQISPKVNSEPSIESLPKDEFDNDDDLFGWILTI